MSTAASELPALAAPPRTLRADTLAASVVILLVMTVAQRAIGFGRGILFCRWLPVEELGAWDVAFAFVNLAAPIAVLGLPGSFGRYAEYFRARGQFRAFLRRTTLVTAAAALAATALLVGTRGWFSQLIFGSPDSGRVVIWVALCLASVILHNYLTSLFIAVRMYRVVTVLQFAQSLGFAVLSLALLAFWPSGATSVVIGYAAATLLSSAISLGWLGSLFSCDPERTAPPPLGAFWARLVPFAVWMWVTNLVSNLFDVIDRYMIVHHGRMTAAEALIQIGNYHTSRIVPLLFVGVAGLLASVITPHLAHDWELGRRRTVARRLNLTLKILALALLAASTVVLFAAPWLFRVALESKFPRGLDVLPCTLAYCAWFGTLAVAVNYLWCAERPALASLPLAIGLTLNVGLNILLLPRYGLAGAVWATTAANLAALVLTYLFSRAGGMHVDAGTWVSSLSLASLCFGPWTASAVLGLMLAMSLAGVRLLTRREKRELAATFAHAVARFHALRRTVGAAATAAD
jgi:O-antigen/teichoic acid export membrane protein